MVYVYSVRTLAYINDENKSIWDGIKKKQDPSNELQQFVMDTIQKSYNLPKHLFDSNKNEIDDNLACFPYSDDLEKIFRFIYPISLLSGIQKIPIDKIIKKLLPFLPHHIQQNVMFVVNHWIFTDEQTMEHKESDTEYNEYQVNDAQILCHTFLVWILGKQIEREYFEPQSSMNGGGIEIAALQVIAFMELYKNPKQLVWSQKLQIMEALLKNDKAISLGYGLSNVT